MNQTPDTGLWLSISEIAERKGVTKQTISERVARFERDGLIASRRGKGKVKLVNLAEYDSAAKETTDLAKAIGRDTVAAARGLSGSGQDASASAAPGARDPSYTQELTRKAGYEADLKAMELQRRRGELLQKSSVVEAMEVIAARLNGGLDRLPAYAEELTGAAMTGGPPAVRARLKDMIFRIRTAMAEDMSRLADESPDCEAALDTVAPAEVGNLNDN